MTYEYLCSKCNQIFQLQLSVKEHQSSVIHDCGYEAGQFFSVPYVVYKGTNWGSKPAEEIVRCARGHQFSRTYYASYCPTCRRNSKLTMETKPEDKNNADVEISKGFY